MTLGAELAASYRPVLIVATGRSGSVFLHSLFDGHPGVLSYPAVHGLYSPWFAEDLVRTPADAALYIQHFSRLAIHFQGRYDEALGSLGPDGTANFILPREDFLRFFVEELEALGPPVSRRKMVLALHAAWGRMSGFDFSVGRVLLEHVHNPAFLGAALADFPDASTLQTIREPLAGYYGMIDFCRKAYGHFKSEFFFKFTRDVFLEPWLELVPRAALAPARHRLVPIEEINSRGRGAMREIADWLGIEDHDTFATSTVGGLLCHGNSGRIDSITSYSTPPPRRAGTYSRLDRTRLALILGDVPARAGYRLEAPPPRFWDSLALLAPLRSELRPRPLGLVRDAVHDAACFDLRAMVLLLLDRRHPLLARLARRFGAHLEGSLPARALSAALLLLLIVKRLCFDPPVNYLRRVRLYVRAHARTKAWRRRGGELS